MDRRYGEANGRIERFVVTERVSTGPAAASALFEDPPQAGQVRTVAATKSIREPMATGGGVIHSTGCWRTTQGRCPDRSRRRRRRPETADHRGRRHVDA